MKEGSWGGEKNQGRQRDSELQTGQKVRKIKKIEGVTTGPKELHGSWFISCPQQNLQV